MFHFFKTPGLCFGFVFFILNHFCLNLKGQERTMDSLSLVLKTARHDTMRCYILNAMVEAENDDRIWPGYNEQLKVIVERNLAQKGPYRKTYLKYMTNVLNNLGYLHTMQGNVLKALEYLRKGLAIQEELGDKKDLAVFMNNIGSAYHSVGDVLQALEYFHKSLKLNEEIGNKKGIAVSLNNLGQIHDVQHEYKEALIYYQRSLKIKQEIGDKKGMGTTLNNIGSIYDSQGNATKSLEYHQKSLKLMEDIGDKNGVAIALNNIGTNYRDAGNINEALDYFYRSLEVYEELDQKSGISTVLNNIALQIMKKGKMADAIAYATKGMQAAKEVGYPEDIRNAALTMKAIYQKQHKFKEALAMYELEMQMRDSVINQNNKEESLKKELKYEYNKKELQSKLKQEQKLSDLRLENERKHSRKNMLVYGLVFLAMMLGMSILYVVKFFKQKNIINANKNNELKQKLLLTQMNPHFIFNSVDNIQSLILQKQDQEAVNYLSKFSKLTRQILENSTENYITLTEELAMTDNYLNIQQLLYNNKFTYTITVDERIDPEIILLPPMLTQPFIENAVKHGLKNKVGNGLISIRFSIDKSVLRFEVTDNGPGFSNEEKKSDHRSMAMNITKERLISYTKNDHFLVQSENVKNTEGMVVGAKILFEIPYIYEN